MPWSKSESSRTCVTLRRYLEGGVDALVERVLVGYFDAQVPNWGEHAQPYLGQGARHPTARFGVAAFLSRTGTRRSTPAP